MRIWDIHPGYLNRQSLLGEHRELHAVVSVLVHHKKGYSHHPETLRWRDHGWALKMRHRLLAAEMRLRGYHEKSPVKTRSRPQDRPGQYVDPPARQLVLLRRKYLQKEKGRIEIPHHAHELWSHYKYSVMARSYALYKEVGPLVAHRKVGFARLTRRLVETLWEPPSAGSLRNALLHMWGHVSKSNFDDENGEFAGILFRRARPDQLSSRQLFREIQRRALLSRERYLLSSTALSELEAWL